ncbi:MAG TPA: NUDIX domain-containing protein [Acidimicrobiia bacterium]
MKQSAGLLPFKLPDLEVLIAHPGGPFWASKDAGHWSIVKGELHSGEDPSAAAVREFTEETGWRVAAGEWIDLGMITQRSGKLVRAWGVEEDFDVSTFSPGMFTMMWRGAMREFPEIDKVRWANPETARRLLQPSQAPLLDRLLDQIAPRMG